MEDYSFDNTIAGRLSPHPPNLARFAVELAEPSNLLAAFCRLHVIAKLPEAGKWDRHAVGAFDSTFCSTADFETGMKDIALHFLRFGTYMAPLIDS